MGQKVRPTGFRTGIMIDWLSQLVRQQAGLRRAAGRRLQDPQVRQEEVRPLGHRPHPDRADAREGHGLHLLGPRRHDHRQEGPGGRQADQGAGRPVPPAHRSQDDGGQPAGGRSAAGGRGHRRAAGKAGQLSPDHEAGHRADDGSGRQGRSHSAVRPAGRVGNGPDRKRHGSAAFRFRRCGPRSSIGFAEAKTAQGHIGIKVWINNGDYLNPEEDSDAANAQAGKVPKKPARRGKR